MAKGKKLKQKKRFAETGATVGRLTLKSLAPPRRSFSQHSNLQPLFPFEEELTLEDIKNILDGKLTRAEKKFLKYMKIRMRSSMSKKEVLCISGSIFQIIKPILQKELKTLMKETEVRMPLTEVTLRAIIRDVNFHFTDTKISHKVILDIPAGQSDAEKLVKAEFAGAGKEVMVKVIQPQLKMAFLDKAKKPDTKKPVKAKKPDTKKPVKAKKP